jgi:hypothetical protein
MTHWVAGEIKSEASDAEQVLTQRVKRTQAKGFCQGVVSIVPRDEV